MSNLKTDMIYKEILNLPVNEKIILFSRLMNEISIYIARNQTLNFYDIKGIGKDIWKDIDAQEYVNKERDSWD
ncbi:MAG: hypothetical protein ABRQ39_19075 [Candidatus Eremiobacterota bacterium]